MTQELEPLPDPTPEEARPLHPRHIKLIDAYLGPAEFNASEAARLAGYVDNDNGSIRVQAHRVLSRANVQREIQRRINASRLTPEYIIDGLMLIADMSTNTDTYDPQSGIKALTQLGKIQGMFDPKRSEEGNNQLSHLTDDALRAILEATGHPQRTIIDAEVQNPPQSSTEPTQSE